MSTPPRTPRRWPVALARTGSTGVVAGIAAWSSYHHMVDVALRVGERPDVAYVLPLSVDGMLVVASVAMVDDRRAGRTVRWSAKLAFTVGVLASVAANVAHAEPTVGARIVAAWPAVALLLVVELLSRTGRLLGLVDRVKAAGADPATPAEPDNKQDTPPAVAPVFDVVDIGPDSDPYDDDTAGQVPGGPLFTATQAKAMAIDPESDLYGDESAGQVAGGPRFTTAQAKAMAIGYALERQDITQDEIGARIGRSQRTVSRYLAAAGISRPVGRPTSGAPVNGVRIHELEAVASGQTGE